MAQIRMSIIREKCDTIHICLIARLEYGPL